ncbi:hypothetical protein [Tsuneonella rigui]|uniref:hypothetical protein n=1 Tax=Tsuneonella rigui TaxID=1708790 RepID=UPI000F7E5686|nr:hypothetical protein [Tsuneonella rigui]
MKTLALLPAFALFAACSQGGGEEPAPAATQDTSPAARAQAAPASPSPVAGRAYRYTSLEGCKLVREEREEREEMPYSEVLCPGPAGWQLRIADADARQTMSVVAPDRAETKLDLSRASGGAFSSFGKTAEWRGPAAERFLPDSLIVRFNVAEQPHPAPEVAYLLAIRLKPTPCMVEEIAPGAGQNDAARAAADAARQCST